MADVPAGWNAKIMHAFLTLSGVTIMGADVAPARYEAPKGFQLFLEADDPADTQRRYDALSEDAAIQMPLQQTLWSLSCAQMPEQTTSQAREYDGPMALRLTPRQRAHLKGRAHALEPVVQVGQSGASQTVVAEVDRSLTAHGLIKVKLAGADRAARQELTAALCGHTGAVAVQQVGRVLTLWRPRPDDDPLEP